MMEGCCKLALVIYDFEVEVQSFISGFNPSEKVFLKMLINTMENHKSTNMMS